MKIIDSLGGPRDNSKDPTPYAVICHTWDDEPEIPGCGLVFLKPATYRLQMAQPNKTWRCPQCGREADWDDYCQETNPENEHGAHA